MADLFVTLASIAPISSKETPRQGERVPGISPAMKDGVLSERACAVTYFPSPLLTGLAAFYKLDGNGLDSLGAHPGTGYGAWGAASPPGYYVTGKMGQGFSMTPGEVPNTPFDGWHQTRMDLSPPIALGTSWTLSCWHKMGGTITGHPPDLVITQAAFGYGMRVAYGGKISWGDFVTQSNTNVTAGWHMLTETYDGTTLRYYLDGVADGTSVSVLPSFSPDRFFFSQFDRTSKSYVLDDVGMWTRPLSPAEITALYAGGAGLSYPF
jgi:hypothetical protein